MADLSTAGALNNASDDADFGTPDSVVPTSSSLLLSAATSEPRGGDIVNGSTVAVYIRFGAAASLTNFHAAIPIGGTYHLPGQTDDAIYMIGTGSPTGRVQFVPITLS